jgi:5-methylcytosine-specific restriction enzyme A
MHAPHDTAACELCRRQVPRRLITLHHLKPKAEGGKHTDKAPLCKPCHKQIHATFSNKELAKHYADLEALRATESLQPFLKWIAKQNPARNFRTATSKSHPNSARR